MRKSEIRKLYQEKRMNLTSEKTAIFSSMIAANFKKIPVSGINLYLSYSPLTIRREFDPSEIENILAQNFPEAIKLLPVVVDESGMEAVIPDKGAPWVKNRYGIEEPSRYRVIAPENIRLVLVPLIAVDREGYRVGFGKGYYDRFLKRCRKDTLTIGFSWFSPVEKIDDRGDWDVPIKYCVTPETIYEF